MPVECRSAATGLPAERELHGGGRRRRGVRASLVPLHRHRVPPSEPAHNYGGAGGRDGQQTPCSTALRHRGLPPLCAPADTAVRCTAANTRTIEPLYTFCSFSPIVHRSRVFYAIPFNTLPISVIFQIETDLDLIVE